MSLNACVQISHYFEFRIIFYSSLFFSDAKHFEGRRSITYISDSRLVYILYFHRNLLISLER